MQELSFHFDTPVFTFGGQSFSLMVYSFTNAYAPDAAALKTTEGKDSFTAEAAGLTWAGGQERAAGHVAVRVDKTADGLRFAVSAAIGREGESIRCVKLSLHGQPEGDIVNLIDARPRSIPPEGLNLKYPEGWREVGTPLLVRKTGDSYIYYRSLDGQVRDKRFVFTRDGGDLTAELFFEEKATEMTRTVQVPDWVVGRVQTLEEAYAPHMAHLEQSYGLEPWETRPDVPDWAREISLVAAIHMQHWTGYVFNDYASALRQLRAVCERVEGKRVLAYLPGWEGRYYWKYGNYGPDERMGGAEGFHMLCDGARKLGVHVMPMFGINIVGVHFDGYETWGAPGEFRSASGSVYGGSVDWDASRHFDHGSNRNLNPAAPGWQNRLVDQVTTLMDAYGFDAAFFDIAAVWQNDPNHYLYDGVKRLMQRLKSHKPDMLLAGEAWYDALAACIPLLQCGHTDGVLHWHDDAWTPLFDRYARGFGHLCLGDPSRGSTGVHELGTNPQWRAPLRKGVIPTITIVEDSLEKAPERCAQIFDDANEYAKRFL